MKVREAIDRLKKYDPDADLNKIIIEKILEELPNRKQQEEEKRIEYKKQHNIEYILFGSRGEAELVLDAMVEIIMGINVEFRKRERRYYKDNAVMLYDYYELIGKDDLAIGIDEHLGWSNLDKARIMRDRFGRGYYIDFPDLEEL